MRTHHLLAYTVVSVCPSTLTEPKIGSRSASSSGTAICSNEKKNNNIVFLQLSELGLPFPNNPNNLDPSY